MHTLIIITAAIQSEANASATAHFDPVGGELTFSVQLVTPPDLATVTHYWCAAPFTSEKRTLLDVMTAQAPFAGNVQVFDYDADADPTFPHVKLAELGLAVCESLLPT